MRTLLKGLALVALIAAIGVLMGATPAEACWGCRWGGCCCYSAAPSCCSSGCGGSSCGSGYGSGYSVGSWGVDTCCNDTVQLDIALRQCKLAYFNPHYSTWIEVDAMVPYYEAVKGVSTCSKVPGLGYVRGWIAEVYDIPRVFPPDAFKK